MSAPPTVVILAGGASSRMGRDKATLELDGIPMMARIAGASRAAGLPCVVVGRRRALPVEGVEVWIDDDMPGEGPLAALGTALRRLRSEILLVACDMPLVDAPCLEWLANHELDPAALALVPRNAGRLEPLFARYRLSALGAIDDLLAAGRRSLGALIEGGENSRYAVVDVPDWLAPKLVNVNTPEDLERLRR
jgi:molybdenum cofactor guanylyltransferase